MQALSLDDNFARVRRDFTGAYQSRTVRKSLVRELHKKGQHFFTNAATIRLEGCGVSSFKEVFGI